jgi:hypothetical protein
MSNRAQCRGTVVSYAFNDRIATESFARSARRLMAAEVRPQCKRWRLPQQEASRLVDPLL